jgi:predicted RNase H-like HicB family nuclease
MGSYTAIVKRDGDWWIGWVEEVPGVNGQEHTREELLASLRLTLAEALDFNRKEDRSLREGKISKEIEARDENSERKTRKVRQIR